MDFLLLFKALILGIVEGLTEFLPVSSTGHLIIAGSLLDYTSAQSKVFEIVIQLGAILAVCWHFRARIALALRGWRRDPSQRRFWLLLGVAFLPAAVLGVLLHSFIKDHLFHPLSVACALAGGGVLMLYIERRAARHPEAIRITTTDDMHWPDAMKVGFAQCIAMWPGVSRSGATIMGGMMFGLSRQTATEFSFFLAIPTMFAATLYDVAKNWELLRAEDLPVFTVGFAASFVFGLLAVKGLIYFVSRHTFNSFAWYRIVFGGVVLLTAWMGWVQWTEH
ncbi:MAG: undecaprenyl-diphosphate phosphatase [Zoogloeaceae bacterium]|jgi:undecaprenyl-diphosphatase|nr:undecaprenyl-diphosphate phosphatase [Zoogloeaceae bacterium]